MPSSPVHRRLGSGLLAAAIGVAGIAAIAFFTHGYEAALWGMAARQVVVNTITPIVFFLAFLLVAIINPLLHKLAPGLRLGRRQLLGVLSVWLLAGVVCYKGLGQPALYAAGNALNPDLAKPMMSRVGFASFLRPALFLPPEPARAYYYGLSDGLSRLPLASLVERVPWGQWLSALAFWAPLMLVVIVFSSALVRMVHRQWSEHELLPYPIAEFAGAYLGHEPGRAFPRVFYDRVFWVGFGVVGFIYAVNGLHAWFPLMVDVPLTFAHYDLIRQFPFLNRYCGGEAYSLFRGMVYPFMIALAVLLPTEVSLSCWLGWVLSIFAIGGYYMVSGEAIGATETGHVQAGMYVAMFVMIVVIGRREYYAILRHAFTRLRRPDDEGLRRAVVACRVFVASFAALVGLLVLAGLNWFVALVLVCSFALVLILIARMTAELGIPWLVSFTGMARALPLKILGSAAIGPQGLAVMAVVGGVLDMNTENTVAAQETTCRKLAEAGGGRSWRFNTVLLLGAGVAILATVVASLWDNYSFGAQKERSRLVADAEAASSEINLLKLEGKGRELDALPLVRRLGLVRAQEGFWRFFLYGAAVIVFIALMRLRFTWWPFHPLPFLLIGSWCLSRLYFSFFLGWVIKVGLLRIGGGRVYTRSKPFFIGAIAGQIAVAGLWLCTGAVYHAATGQKPPLFSFFY